VDRMPIVFQRTVAFFAGLPDGTYIVIPKIIIWVYFEGPRNGKC
jgi:hypothetical protein